MPYPIYLVLNSVSIGGFPAYSTLSSCIVGRLYVAGIPGSLNAEYPLTLPAAGADADAVCVHVWFDSLGAPVYSMAAALIPGRPVLVESGAAFASGANLTPDALGRAVTAAGGNVVVLKAMQAATAAGQYVWARVASGR